MIHMILFVHLGVINSLSLSLCWLQSIVKVEDGKLVHIQKWDGKETTLVREVNGNALTLVSAHTNSYIITSVCVCVCCILTLSLSLSLHHRPSHSEKSLVNVAMRRQSNIHRH